ncbi:hypothetical protein IWW36_002077 [Coemansia brasiliensis]|uniref:non-specific serine/threonine protein kinase n=1 Tax=Coemansia brasiliensis TaxID=2650707 RepID=A0A9W8ICS1_9FUNG|nr:hypothetical protein IWW36_002077 [Coemansia brasiliensis]
MGRLSLAIGRQKEAGDGRSKPRHLRSSIKGFLGIPGAERASVDLGDIDHSSLDDNASQSSVRNSINHLHRLHEREREQQPQVAPFEANSLAKRTESGFADSQPTHPIIREHRTIKASHNLLRTTASSVPLHAYAEDAAPRIERNSVGVDRDIGNDSDKSSWRRRGSLISSRLAVPLRKDTVSSSNNGSLNSRVLVRKESTPQLDVPSRPSNQLPPHPELPDQGKSPFWRGSSTLRVAGAMALADTGETAAAQQERTHRSSSVPFLTPIPANATAHTQISSTVSGKSVASPYLRAVSSGLSTQSMRRSARGYSSTHQDRFPKLALNEEGDSTPGSPTTAAMSPSDAGGDPTPMTFLVSPRARASSSIRHITGHPLSNTPSRDLNLSKRTLSSSTIPSLELNAPASPRALTGGVDMSEFGVVVPSSVGPSSLSESTPISATFEPLNESAEDTEPCGGADKAADAVHETHHMEVQHDPRTGRKMINQYMIIRELGRGTHGKVKLAFDTIAGEYYAIKVIDKESHGRARRMRQSSAAYRSHRRSHGYLRIDLDKMEKVKREIAILKKCRHPNVVRLREVIDDAHARRIYLVIEFMDGGEIAWRDSNNLPVMAADKARSVFRDLVLGVEYLHYVGILHRDLKPQNLLCNRAGTVKISDFGVSFLSRQTRKPPSQHAMQPPKTPPVASPQPPDRSAITAGSQLHHFASQPLMSGLSSPNRPTDSAALHRKASALSRGSGIPGSPSGSESSSLRIRAPPIRHPHYAPPASQLQRHIRRQATLGMTDEFGNCQSEPAEPPIDGMAASPGHKLPPEFMSADASVYDPFDSSESAEFFSSSDDAASEYGSQLPQSSLGMSGAIEGMGKLGLDEASEDGGSDNGIVFGVLPSPSKTAEMQPRSSQGHSGHQRKGTLGEITFDYDEKDEERELAKTAGTPAFFAPELCCTAEELAKVLKEEHLRRQAQSSLEPPHSSAQLPLTDGESMAGNSARPASLFIESPVLNEGLRGPSKVTKRHSALTSLLSRPFSSKGRPSTGNSSQSSIRASSARQEDTDAHSDDELTEQPLPANVITPAIDIWAMGVTLYCLIYGRVPFQATTEFELFNIIPRKPLEFPEYLEVAEDNENGDDTMLFGVPAVASAAGSTSGKAEHKLARRVSLPPLDPDLRDLLTRLLDKDFRTRITIDEIKRHPWVLKDLDRPNTWATETDPKSQPSVTITTREVEQAMVPKVRQRRGFRASVKHRISMLSPRTNKNQRPESRQPMHMGGAKAKSSLDWLKIW